MVTSNDPGFRAWSLIVDVWALLSPIFAQNLGEIGMSMSSFDVLVNLLIADNNEARMSDLAERTVISFSRVSRVVDDLEEQGFVERRPDPKDGRAVIIKLTPAGRRHLRQAVRVHVRDVQETFSAHLSEEQALAVIDALDAVMGAHGRVPSATAPWDSGR